MFFLTASPDKCRLTDNRSNHTWTQLLLQTDHIMQDFKRKWHVWCLVVKATRRGTAIIITLLITIITNNDVDNNVDNNDTTTTTTTATTTATTTTTTNHNNTALLIRIIVMMTIIIIIIIIMIVIMIITITIMIMLMMIIIDVWRNAGPPRTQPATPHRPPRLGDSTNTVRGYCLDMPRFEESPNN